MRPAVDDTAQRMEFYVNHLTAEENENDVSSGTSVPASNGEIHYSSFPLLETIAEETAEELQLELEQDSCSSSPSFSSSSGRWGWGWGWLTDDDSSSVIHVSAEPQCAPKFLRHASTGEALSRGSCAPSSGVADNELKRERGARCEMHDADAF